jgi:chromate transporter
LRSGENSAVNGGGAGVLATLFWEMFKIALTVVGGGLAIATVADEIFSKKLRWTKEGEIIDSLPIVQMVPGLIAGNVAVYIGRKVAGWKGSVVAAAAVSMPSLAIFLAVSAGYGGLPADHPVLSGIFSSLRSALTAIVVAAIIRSWTKCVTGIIGYLVAAAAAAALFCGMNPAAVIVAAALFSLSAEFFRRSPHENGRTRFRSASLAAVALIFLKYGSLAFGGGYVLIPFYIHDFVGASAPYVQLAERDFSNLMALTQMTPGPIAVNAATFFGYCMRGVIGSVVATVCVLLPGFIMMHAVLCSIERFRDSRILAAVMRGIRPATEAMMISAAWSFAAMSVWSSGDGMRPFETAVFAFALAALLLGRITVMKTIAASALAGAVHAFARSFFSV